jgi:hypothetical protein
MHVFTSIFRCAALVLLVLWQACASDARAGAPIDERQALHLLNRLGYGPAPGDVARVRKLGVGAYVEHQLAPPPMPARLEARLHELAHPMAHPGVPASEETLLRAIASPRQLEEVLAAFWLNHFMGGQHGEAIDSARAVLRPHVLDRYATLRAALVEHARGQGKPVAGGGQRDALRALVGQFVSTPSSGLQASLARVWDRTGGDQRAVLRALFTSREFLAPAEWNSMRKDGWRFVVSAVRASGVAVENVAPLMEFVRRPLADAERAEFVERLAGGRLALAMAPPHPGRYASSAPPLRATVPGDPPQGTLAQPGPVLMEAPTPSAAAMASAARSRPADAAGLRALLGSADFLRY